MAPSVASRLRTKGLGGIDRCTGKLMAEWQNLPYLVIKVPGHVCKPRKIWNDVVLV